MGGKLGKQHTYVVSGQGTWEEIREDRRGSGRGEQRKSTSSGDSVLAPEEGGHVGYAEEERRHSSPSPHRVGFAEEGGGSFSDDDTYSDEPVIPTMSKGRRGTVFAEAYNPEEDDEDDVKVIHPKSDEQRRRLQERVKMQLLFRTLDQAQLNEVIDAMFEQTVAADEVVIEQGADGDFFYVVDKGVYHALIKTKEGEPLLKVFEYNGEGNFGELALLYNQPRAATVQAITEGTLWKMDRQTFRKIVLKSAFQKRKMYEKFLSSVSLLEHLNTYDRENIADALVGRSFSAGEAVVRQGDDADGMYFVEAGTLLVLKKLEGEEEEKTVNEVHQGGYFGELALVNHDKRAATVAAKDDVKVAFLDTAAFERLLGPCMETMKEKQVADALKEKQVAEAFRS